MIFYYFLRSLKKTQVKWWHNADSWREGTCVGIDTATSGKLKDVLTPSKTELEANYRPTDVMGTF